MTLRDQLKALSERLIPESTSATAPKRRPTAKRRSAVRRDLVRLLRIYKVESESEFKPLRRDRRIRRLRKLAKTWDELPLPDRVTIEVMLRTAEDLGSAARAVAESLPGADGGRPLDAMKTLREGALLVFEHHSGTRAKMTKDGEFADFLGEIFDADAPDYSCTPEHEACGLC